MTFTKEKAGKTHNLKIWPEYFAAVRDGLKRAELRCNDRDYQADDTLELCEWDPNEEAFTGEYISVTVTHVADIGQWMPGYVLLSIAAPQPLTTSERAELENYRNAQPDVNYQRLSELYHVQEKRLFKLAQRIKGSAFDKYAHSPSQAIDVLESALFGESDDTCRAAMLQGAENVESRCTIQTAPALDSSPKIAEWRCSNSPVIPDGLRLALSNAGIAAPESDEMLAATCEKYIQALVTWVKDRKPFRSAVIPDCWCCTCRPVKMNDMRFVVCPECGNKRCPHANDHRNACTGSNEPGQEGSAYPAAPQQEVKGE